MGRRVSVFQKKGGQCFITANRNRIRFKKYKYISFRIFVKTAQLDYRSLNLNHTLEK